MSGEIDKAADSLAAPLVSVIVPARNAESSLAVALDSILAQDYPGPVEIIVADGSDSSATAELVREQYPTVQLLRNPKQTTPHGLNLAIRAARGEILARCDCQAALPPDYLRRAVATLSRTGAAVVGGRQQPVGETPFERAVGMALVTPLGVGGTRYRLGGGEGPVDTVYLGVFRREALEAAGGFDPKLTRNQDEDLNWRLRQLGETVWFDPSISACYRPRGSLGALARQYFDYGRWKPLVLLRNPAELRARHLAAPMLVLGLLAMIPLAFAGAGSVAVGLPLLYMLLLLLGALNAGVTRRDPAALLLPLALATMHLSWGTGFFLPVRGAPRQKPSAHGK